MRYSEAGHANLEVLEKADKFSTWMYSEFKPFLKGDILEIGSGIGTFSERIAKDFTQQHLYFSDADPSYVLSLKERYSSGTISHLVLDISEINDFKPISGVIDSAFALNVLEHVRDDESALRNVHSALRPGGVFLLIVPAHKSLFNSIDKAVNHYRRYSKDELIGKSVAAGFTPKHVFYFNVFGMVGWFLNGSLLGNPIVNKRAMGMFDALVPFFCFFERHILGKRMGLSLVAVLEK